MKSLVQLDMSSQRIVNVASPSSGTDAVNKTYVDDRLNGQAWKLPVRAATTTALTLATAFANGQVVDGVTLATNDAVLIKDQAAGAENGIYTVNAAGAPTRRTDMDISAEAVNNTTVAVMEGTINADKAFTLTNNGTITLGTTALVWAQLPGSSLSYSNGTGISLTGTVFSIDTSVVQRKYATNIGDGSATSIVVTHNLGTKDIVPACRTVADDSFVICDVVATSTNTATFTFAVAPASSAYRAIITG